MLLALLLSCGVERDNFGDKYGEHICDYFVRCGNFTAEECPEEMADVMAMYNTCADNCIDYDANEAAECLRELDAASCDIEMWENGRDRSTHEQYGKLIRSHRGAIDERVLAHVTATSGNDDQGGWTLALPPGAVELWSEPAPFTPQIQQRKKRK